MSPRREGGGRLGGRLDGSALLLVLFVCMAVAVVVQTLTAVTMCAQRARAEERQGRSLMAERDRGLADLVAEARCRWSGRPGLDSDDGPEVVEGGLSEVGTSGWVLEASCRQSAPRPAMTASAWVERGRDGLDLPMAALVAGRLEGSAARDRDWVCGGQAPGDAGEVPVYATEMTPGCRLGAGCTQHILEVSWKLDPVWAQMTSGDGVAGPRALFLQGGRGQVVSLAGELDGSAPNRGAGGSGRDGAAALLVVLTGGAELDARGLGDFYGVMVVDDGSVRLDGTTLHGAVFAGKTIDLGSSGQVAFSRLVLRWATDRSVVRARLVPGSRTEGME